MSNQNEHYYATCALGWQTADTQDEAVRKLIAYNRDSFKRMAANQIKENKQGAYIWSCKVPLPSDANYNIEFYSPKVEGLTECREHYVTRVTTKEINYWSQDQVQK